MYFHEKSSQQSFAFHKNSTKELKKEIKQSYQRMFCTKNGHELNSTNRRISEKTLTPEKTQVGKQKRVDFHKMSKDGRDFIMKIRENSLTNCKFD